MKKTMIIIILMMCMSLGNRGNAQAYEIEQLALDISKLAELKNILSDMKTAYEIISGGYTTIKNIVEGNFNLHQAFLDGLLAVSGNVKNYKRIADIISTEAMIVKEYKSAQNYFQSQGRFTYSELNYISSVYSALFKESEKCLDELIMVVTAGQMRMSDDERLEAIDRIYKDITGKLVYLRSFNNSAATQAMQRSRDANDVGTLQSFYGIKQ